MSKKLCVAPPFPQLGNNIKVPKEIVKDSPIPLFKTIKKYKKRKK